MIKNLDPILCAQIYEGMRIVFKVILGAGSLMCIRMLYKISK